ncbi:hypothetical protein BV195_01839 [Haemophilus influenzae]|uniref:Uncharacterized protein n=1 Tax=Haemophilus influenzae TaxID=727 RepID=A0A2S9RN87_HAEIF|nr:hypothetical protein BVZ70_01179 [Haemophilus influenzae]PRI82649.1 hypothetical protein BV020_01169 [Haemophilus influenzae]PRI86245.1 hypothetical protein BV021_01496 [Haemophilus influenzae]PRJ58238.1 hypothetical protein BV102_00513 [Haemophilus influenzae]PRJ87360.1 hypothetical protein BV154_01173 [Haemophilus influenzae]
MLITLRSLLHSVVVNDMPKNKRMTKVCKAKYIIMIQNLGYKELNCLESWLLFCGQQVATFDDLFQYDLYHYIRQSDYPKADGYLMQESFYTLLSKFSDDPKALFILVYPIYALNKKAKNRLLIST